MFLETLALYGISTAISMMTLLSLAAVFGRVRAGGVAVKKCIILSMILCISAPTFAQTAARNNNTVVIGAIGVEPRQGVRRALETQIKIAFVNSGNYIALTREEAVLSLVYDEHEYQRSGNVDDAQIRQIGRQFGAQFVCVVEILPVMNSFLLNAQLVNIETAQITAIASVPSDLRNSRDFRAASGLLVSQLLGGQGGGNHAGGNYGRGVFLDASQNLNSISNEIVNVLKSRVAITDGTCLSGVTLHIESDPQPTCADGSFGFTCRAEVSLIITQCGNGARNTLRGSVVSTDRNSMDNARRRFLREMSHARFLNEWVTELQKWSNQ